MEDHKAQRTHVDLRDEVDHTDDNFRVSKRGQYEGRTYHQTDHIDLRDEVDHADDNIRVSKRGQYGVKTYH
jgi:hypothetical protein